MPPARPRNHPGRHPGGDPPGVWALSIPHGAYAPPPRTLPPELSLRPQHSGLHTIRYATINLATFATVSFWRTYALHRRSGNARSLGPGSLMSLAPGRRGRVVWHQV